MPDPARPGLLESVRLLREKKMSSVEMVGRALDRIAALNPRTNAFISVAGEAALDRARAMDQAPAAGGAGPLRGVPIAIKDLFDRAGEVTTAGSPVFSDRLAASDATSVARLESAGAVIVGKTNLHEFAYGVTSENPHFGAVRNPWATGRISGGSSGGSAVAVALGMAAAALGTDTGGSIRIPSALCGIVGLKPTWGRVSGAGVVPLAWSFDTFGPMTQTVGDAALLLEVISGFDPRDPRTRLAPDPQFVSRHLEDGASGLRIGVPRYAFDNVDAAVAGLVRGALSALEGMGAALVEVDLPSPGRHEEVFRVIAGLEVLAWHAPCISVSGDRYSPATRERIEAAGGFGPSDYIEARQSCMALQAAVLECFDQVDLLALPASPMPASPLGQDPVDVAGSSERVLLALTRFNRLFSVTGFPAISVPCGLTGARLPAGLQLAGRPFDEERVLRAARAYEREVGGFPLPPPEPADPGSSG